MHSKIRLARAVRLVAMTAAVAGCGGQSQPPPAVPTPVLGGQSPASPSSEPPPPAPWVEVDVQAVRVGSSIRLDITGTGHNHREGQPFEDPENWHVTASTDTGEQLQRLVNGSTRVARHPTGQIRHNLWDVIVEFSCAFTLPKGAETVDVVVTPPGSSPKTILLNDLNELGSSSPASRKRSRVAPNTRGQSER